MKRSRLRPVSLKRRRLMRERRRIVALLLETQPSCQICDMYASRHIHEVKSRARGGSITDLPNLMAVCPSCHRFIHANPEWAESRGFLRHSWD